MIRRISNALRCLAVVAALLQVMPIPALAISESLVTARQGFQAAMDNGDFEAALPFAEDTVELAEDEFPRYDPRTAAFQFDLAVLYGQLGKVSKAPKLLKSAIRILEKTDQPNNEFLLDVYQAISNTYIAMGKPKLGWPYLEDKLTLEEGLYGMDSLALEGTLRDVAQIAVMTRSITYGVPYYVRLSEIFATNYGRDDEIYGDILVEIGDMYRFARKRSNAEDYFLRALELFQSNYPGDDRSRQIYQQLGNLYAEAGDEERAGEFLAKGTEGRFHATPLFMPFFSYAIARTELYEPANARVNFTVAKDGTTKDIEVVSASPARLGRKLARAIEDWRFEPVSEEGLETESRETHFISYVTRFNTARGKQLTVNTGTRTGSRVHNVNVEGERMPD